MNKEFLLKNEMINAKGHLTRKCRKMLADDNHLMLRLLERTSFLPATAKITIRIKSIVLDIHAPWPCAVCGAPMVRFTPHKNLCCGPKCTGRQIDPGETKSRRSLGMEKMAAVRNAIDKDGTSSYSRSARKVADGLQKIDPTTGKSLRHEINGKAAEKMKQEGTYEKMQNSRRATLEKQGDWIPLEDLPANKIYKSQVYKVTAQQSIHMLKNYDLRQQHGGMAFHIDHIFSIFDGFNQGIPPYIIGGIHNLQIIPAIDNIRKHSKSGITKEELYARYAENVIN